MFSSQIHAVITPTVRLPVNDIVDGIPEGVGVYNSIDYETNLNPGTKHTLDFFSSKETYEIETPLEGSVFAISLFLREDDYEDFNDVNNVQGGFRTFEAFLRQDDYEDFTDVNNVQGAFMDYNHYRTTEDFEGDTIATTSGSFDDFYIDYYAGIAEDFEGDTIATTSGSFDYHSMI